MLSLPYSLRSLWKLERTLWNISRVKAFHQQTFSTSNVANSGMANSKYAYVKGYELPDPLLPGMFMIFRLDGHSFHRFSEKHGFEKPNDPRALQLMDHAARNVMEEYPDIVLAFGESDEYSFLLRKSTILYNRRRSKIVSTLTSMFTSCYVFHWSTYLPNTPLQYPPSFDGRIVLYPTEKHIHDYFAWRQTDTHINNLYNSTFWALVQQGGQSTTQAHETLRGTVSKEKHEILFSQFGINYNGLDERFRKGSILVREEVPLTQGLEGDPIDNESNRMDLSHSGVAAPGDNKDKKRQRKKKEKPRTKIDLLHCDIIGDKFWESRPNLLNE